MKKSVKILSTVSCFLMVFALLASIIDYCCFDRNFYIKEYAQNDTGQVTGMSDHDLMRATDTLLEYLRDERDDIVLTADISGVEREVYTERETLHMIDVKALYQNAILLRNIALFAGAVIMAVLLYQNRKHMRAVLKAGFASGASLVILTVIFIAVWAVADFDQFWTSFHLLFFDNDLWLLNPAESIMINLFPSNFFYDLVIRIILIFLGILIVLSLLIYRIRVGKKS